jgi:glycosyltransferase involved in cell wall biosynthesis
LVLFFGLIRAYKGLDLLLEAFSKQQVKDLNLKLIIAGEFYDKKEKYRALIEKLGIQNSIVIEDAFIPNSRVPLYMSVADVLVQPYRHATQSGVSPLAMHFNLPMIVTRVGGLSESVVHEKTGLVTEPDSQSIADSIIEYFDTGKEAFVTHLNEHKKQYTWSFMADGIVKMSEELNSLFNV